MNEASDLIEQAEALAGCRWDDESNPNGFYALLGAVGRAMGKNPHHAKDDIAAGMLLSCQMTEAYAREQAGNKMIAALLTGGLSPDDIGALLSKK